MIAPTTNLWQASPQEQFEGAHLDGSVECDVVVIGGGYTGLSAALHIAESGGQVCLLEAHTVGRGGSGRNVGLVNAGLWMPPDKVEALLGQKVGARLNADLAKGPQLVFDLIETHQILCDPLRNATLHCAETRAGVLDLQNRYQQQITRGAPVILLDREEVAKKTGSDRFLAALRDPRAGTIQPLSYARGLARAARAAGAVIYENTPAETVSHDGANWSIRTTNGRIVAQKLVQATNAYGHAGGAQRGFTPVHYFQFATAPLSQEQRAAILPDGEGCWDCATVMTSFRLAQDGRLLIGAVGNLDGFGRRAHGAWARRKMGSLFPGLADMAFEHGWCGRIAFTSDKLPKVVDIGPNAVSIFGYSGRGISPGTVFGKAAAEWAKSGDDQAFPIPISQGASDSLRGFKALYFEAGAVLAHWLGTRGRPRRSK